MYRQSEKNLLNCNIFSAYPHNMANFGPLTAEIHCTSANFNGFCVLASLLQQRRSPETNKTARCLAVSWAGTHIHFGRCCPLAEFCQLQHSLCVQVLRSILASLLHGTRAAAVSQAWLRGTRNGITELSQREPLIFGWAAIALGIGPHPSSLYL